MKTIFFVGALFFSIMFYGQSKFSLGFGLSTQSVSKDFGFSYEGSIGYDVTSDMTISLLASKTEMENKTVNYNIDKYGLLLSFDFAKSEKMKLESLFGFNYLIFDEKILQRDNKDMGIDIGIQTTFGLNRRIKYGVRLLGTYSSIAPGAMLNAGAFFKTNL